jgi:hypothetical protein
MIKRFLSAALFFTLSVPLSLAQSSSDTPASHEDIVKLFDTMKIRSQLQMIVDATSKQQREIMHDTLHKNAPQLTEKELSHLDQEMDDVMKEVAKDLPIEGLLDDMIPIYQKHLTKSDVDAMNVFYSSPTGQKLLREMPAMTAESMQAATPRMQAVMEKAMARVQDLVKDEVDKEQSIPHATPDKK